AHSNLLLMLNYSPHYDAAAIYEEHRRFTERHAKPLVRMIRPHSNDRSTDRRLRIGYFSPHFRTHAASLFLAPLFSAHNHQEFEICCYSDVAVPDATTAKLKADSDVWRTTKGLTDARVAELIREDKIDI